MDSPQVLTDYWLETSVPYRMGPTLGLCQVAVSFLQNERGLRDRQRERERAGDQVKSHRQSV